MAKLADGRYWVNARLQYDHTPRGGGREYGAIVKIIRRDGAEGSVQTWVHGHDCNSASPGVHFKNNGSKGGAQGWNLPADQGRSLITRLTGRSLTKAEWTSIGQP